MNLCKVLIFLIIYILFSTNLQAATIGTLEIEGIVAEILSVEIISSDGPPGDGSYSGLDLHTTTNLLEVAQIREISNSTNGYKILVTHDALMENTSAGSTPFPYELYYNNILVNSGNSIEVTNTISGGYNSIKSLKISYTGMSEELLVAGTYKDLITLVIESK